jgi:predicted MPP superfamily phosphohydrolase
MRTKTALPLGLGLALATGVGGLGYASVVERNAFRLRRFEVPVLAPDAEPLRVLHLSDTHLTPGRRRLRDWVAGLAELRPDLVVNTGDNLAAHDAVPAMLEALEPLLSLPGAFVLGSNDYFAPKPKNPARYLFPDTGKRVHGVPLPWRELRDAMVSAGWVDANNAEGRLTVGSRQVLVRGVDDSHIERDDYAKVAGPIPADVDLAIGLSHSPEPRVLDDFVSDGFRLLLCGHTHGGQLRVPGYGALVSNCGLDPKLARGLHRWGLGLDPAWLHVSAGLGTSPYAPVRFACPPEASLLTLVPRA